MRLEPAELESSGNDHALPSLGGIFPVRAVLLSSRVVQRGTHLLHLVEEAGTGLQQLGERLTPFFPALSHSFIYPVTVPSPQTQVLVEEPHG